MQFLWPGLLAALVLVPAPRRGYAWSLRAGGPSACATRAWPSSGRPARVAAGSAATCRSRCSPLALAALVRRPRPAGRDRQRADQPDHDHPDHRRVGQHVLDRHRRPPASRPPRRRGRVHRAARARRPRSGSSPSAASPRWSRRRRPTRPRLLAALPSLTTGRRTAIGSGILASIDAISEIDPSVPASTGYGSPGDRAAAGAAGRLRAGHHRPAHRRRQQHRARSARRRPAGRRPRRPGLHDRLRDGGGRRRSTRPARRQFLGREPRRAAASVAAAASAAAVASAVAAAASGAASTSQTLDAGRRP